MMSVSRIVKWVIINVAVAALIWFGVINNVEGAGNVLGAWAVFTFLVSCGTHMDAVVNAARYRSRAVDKNIQTVVDLGMIGCLVWFGWFWTAAAMLGSYLNMQVYWDEVEKLPPLENTGEPK